LRHAAWARIAGGLLSVGLLSVGLLALSFGAALTLDRGPAAVFSLVVCFCVYVLWVLGWRF